jgi:hypothetical protein
MCQYPHQCTKYSQQHINLPSSCCGAGSKCDPHPMITHVAHHTGLRARHAAPADSAPGACWQLLLPEIRRQRIWCEKVAGKLFAVHEAHQVCILAQPWLHDSPSARQRHVFRVAHEANLSNTGPTEDSILTSIFSDGRRNHPGLKMKGASTMTTCPSRFG